MEAGELIGRAAAALVGVVFAGAGFLKLRSGVLWVRQAAAMGVGHRISWVVPWVEVVLGVWMIAWFPPPWPAAAAGVLLIAFTMLIALRLADGSRPPCACFGARSSRPLGAVDVGRNLILLVLVAVAWLGAA